MRKINNLVNTKRNVCAHIHNAPAQEQGPCVRSRVCDNFPARGHCDTACTHCTEQLQY